MKSKNLLFLVMVVLAMPLTAVANCIFGSKTLTTGETVTGYQSPSITFTEACVEETGVCNANGTVTYTVKGGPRSFQETLYPSCAVDSCQIYAYFTGKNASTPAEDAFFFEDDDLSSACESKYNSGTVNGYNMQSTAASVCPDYVGYLGGPVTYKFQIRVNNVVQETSATYSCPNN